LFDLFSITSYSKIRVKASEGNLLLAGINYDRETKKYSCLIEKADWN